MTITLSGSDRMVTAGTFGAVETFTAVTSTARRTISVHVPVTQIIGGTATSGPNLNNTYLLPGATDTTPPVEGMDKWIKAIGTGPAAAIGVNSLATGVHFGFIVTGTDDNRFIGGGTGLFGATACFNFVQGGGEAVWLKYLNANWWVMGGKATLGTGTG